MPYISTELTYTYLKKMKLTYFLFIFILLSCSSDSENNTANSDNESLWCVPTENIAGGLSVFSTIENPQYKTVSEVESINYLANNWKLALLKINNQVYVYPYEYINYSEIVNDRFDDSNLAISYCPKTESAICFDRKISNDEIITMKASGYLYKENLVPSDTNGKYFWSQMLNEGLRSSSKRIELNTVNMVETTWLNVKNHFQNALVYNHTNINSCNCGDSNEPIDFDNLFGVIHNQLNKTVHLFNYNNFENGNQVNYLRINGKNTIVIGSKENVFFNAFYIPSNLNFEVLEVSEFPNVLIDNEGNKWDVFGYAVEGPRLGQKLDSPSSYVAAEWAWNSIYEDLIIHN